MLQTSKQPVFFGQCKIQNMHYVLRILDKWYYFTNVFHFVVLHNWSGLMIRIYLQQSFSHQKCDMHFFMELLVAFQLLLSTPNKRKKQRVVKMCTVSQLLLSCQVKMNRESSCTIPYSIFPLCDSH